MKTLCLILGDQLSLEISSLKNADKKMTTLLLVEVSEEATYVRHHKQKLVLYFSAMRHFAGILRKEGFCVEYVSLDCPENVGSLTGELERAVGRLKPDAIVVTEPGEYRILAAMNDWETLLGLPVEIRQDDRFFCSRTEFAKWAFGRKSLRMEFFYREMRRKLGWLVDKDGQPEGGKWNYDKDNRKSLPQDIQLPKRNRFPPDSVTLEVIEVVATRFNDHIGDLDSFGWAVTRDDALHALDHFIQDCLPYFGNYQDAMKVGDNLLYHAVLSPYLNIGLLLPEEVCHAVIHAYDQNAAPLNSVEGFIRQVLGWREYIRGIYWLKMPDYADTNFLEADRPLPGFYWTGDTEMNCLREVIEGTKRTAYAHHIQRLMVTGNFALLAGVSPKEVEAWYLAVYADAVEWVELPNTHGMALFADGGVLSSKPYAASGAYVNRMSDYCKACIYDPKRKTGDGACPLNYLYWNYLDVNKARLRNNGRMALPYKNLAKITAKEKREMAQASKIFLNRFF